jgi:hypothetical protein
MGDAARAWIESLPGHEAYAVTTDGQTWTTSGLRPAARATRSFDQQFHPAPVGQ